MLYSPWKIQSPVWVGRMQVALLEILIPGLVGHWLDRYLGSAPWLLILGSIGGLVWALQHVLSSVNAHAKQSQVDARQPAAVQLRTVVTQAPRRPAPEQEPIY